MLAQLSISPRGLDFLVSTSYQKHRSLWNKVEDIFAVRDIRDTIAWHSRVLVNLCSVFFNCSLPQGCPHGKCVQLRWWIPLWEKLFSYLCTLTLQNMRKTSPLPSKACLIYLNRTVRAQSSSVWSEVTGSPTSLLTALSLWPDIYPLKGLEIKDLE